MSNSSDIVTLNTDNTVLINFIRNIALTKLPALRPIAISLGENTNILTAGKSIVQDMIQITSIIESAYYRSKNPSDQEIGFRDSVELDVIGGRVKNDMHGYDIKNGSLTLEDIQQASMNPMTILSEDLNEPLITLVKDSGGNYKDLQLEVIFCNDCGNASKDDNTLKVCNWLGIEPTDSLLNRYVVLPSRHNDITNFKYKIENGVTNVSIDNVWGIPTQEILDLCITELNRMVSSL
jgi:hypothetical protein